MRRTILSGLALAGCLLLAESPANAQNRTQGGGATSGLTGNAGGQGRTATGGRTQGTQGTQGGQQMELNTAAGGSEAVERTFDNGFVGGSDTTGRFIGSEQASQQQLGNSSVPNFQGLTPGAPPAVAKPVSPIRVQARIGFQVPARPRGQVSNRISQQFSRIQFSEPAFRSVQVVPEGNRTITLTGNVPTARDRRLVEMLMKLEPGIDKINNEVNVLAQP